MKNIFIADFLPLANKGEEEIIRGIETLFIDKYHEDITFRVFGDVKSVTQVGNVKVYPRSICYPLNGITGKKRVLNDIWMAIKGFLGLYPYRKNIQNYQGLLNDLRTCDEVIIGHDGFFNLKCALLGIFLSKQNIKYSILGAGFNKPGKKISWIFDKVYKKCFDAAKYIILREQTAYDYVSHISLNKIVELLPDPAFFCPSDKFNLDTINLVEKKYGFDEDALKIGITICENSISFSTAFIYSSSKIVDHREFIKDLLLHVSEKKNCRFYFLPHCIEEGAGNDLVIARDIVSRLQGRINCEIITEDMPVLDIKHIISKMDMMIGERTHSIINSISTSTPFVALTCAADFRTHDIVGKGCGLNGNIYDLDYPDLSKLESGILSILNNRQDAIKKLNKVCLANESKRSIFIQTI